MNRQVQQFNDERAARYATPDNCQVRFNGRYFTRNHPKVCAICGRVFYAFKPVGADWPAYQVDPHPMPGDTCGVRATCGHPACEKAEDELQFKRRLARPSPGDPGLPGHHGGRVVVQG